MTTIAEIKAKLPDTGECVNDDILFADIVTYLEGVEARLNTVEANSFSGAVDATQTINANVANQTSVLPLATLTAELASTDSTTCRVTLTVTGNLSGQGIFEGQDLYTPFTRRASITFVADEVDEFYTLSYSGQFENPSSISAERVVSNIEIPSGATNLGYRVNDLGMTGTIQVQVDLNCSAG